MALLAEVSSCAKLSRQPFVDGEQCCNERPNFDDPLLGFEARGTQLSDRINTWKLFTKSDAFTQNPLDVVKNEDKTKKTLSFKNDDEEEEKHRIANNERVEFNKRMHFGNDAFCGTISDENVQIVIQSDDDLLTVKSLTTVCSLDKNILRFEKQSGNSSLFSDSCEVTNTGECCRSWSLPNYVTFVANKTDCGLLTEKDIFEFKELLRRCLPYYKNRDKCGESMELCGKLPQICENNKKTVFTVLHYLIDEDSLSKNKDSHLSVSKSNIFLPIAKSSYLSEYFKEITKNGLKFNGVEIVAMDLGLKYSMFETIGSDNAFIFLKYFTQLDITVLPIQNSVHFGRAVLSSFVASFTTAAAFFAAYSTKITAMKCFSIFSGTLVVCNFVYTIICLPAAIKLNYCSFQSAKIFTTLFQNVKKTYVKLIMMSTIPLIVIFVLIGTASAVFVFVWPKLRISNSEVFQLFEDKHLFERYDFIYKRQFNFWQSNYNSGDDYGIPVRIVFGLNPEDNGSHLNPRDRGSLVLDDNFNISRKAQQFTNELCAQFRNQSFYKPMLGPLLTNCFTETFRGWIESRMCFDTVFMEPLYPCCRESKFPFNQDIIDKCLKKSVHLIFTGSRQYISSKWAGFWFSKKSSDVSIMVIEYDTKFKVNNSFVNIDDFWTSINSWASYIIENFAPVELKNGFAIADYLDIYAFQDLIISGTQLSVCIALAFAVIAVAVSTLDERLTFVAVITIASIILNTIAVLVLIGWQVNVIESICICIAIGLSVDSTLHYTMALKLSPMKKRKDRLTRVYSLMFCPVSVSNLTTLITGAVIRFSVVLPYQQFGDFLIVISIVNWVCSTFFFVVSTCNAVQHET
ncbi:protein dispatched 1-like protein [Leptotrombidium deliense]|uniref:Protein dispatched 1-like protein n=1 Tax=Leptotrombidium deliense TaxID=299467 RepID=A0A443SHA3_9ACAR|nr:protein dispatched 1-like protein [Leptotrombidium deliense]